MKKFLQIALKVMKALIFFHDAAHKTTKNDTTTQNDDNIPNANHYTE